MVNDIFSIINSEKYKKVRGIDNEIKEIKNFIIYLNKHFSINSSEIEKKSKTFLLNKKPLLKKAFNDANNINELALFIAQIYAKIFIDFVKKYNYNNVKILKISVIKVQFKILKNELQEN